MSVLIDELPSANHAAPFVGAVVAAIQQRRAIADMVRAVRSVDRDVDEEGFQW